LFDCLIVMQSMSKALRGGAEKFCRRGYMSMISWPIQKWK